MKQVTDSLIGEALSEGLLREISKIMDSGKKSAYDRIEGTLKSYKKMHKEKSPEEKYHLLHGELKVNVKFHKKIVYLKSFMHTIVELLI